MLIDRPPHPTRLKSTLTGFSPGGQKAYVDATTYNSRRLDVIGPPDFAPRPGVKYADFNKEEFTPVKLRTIEIAKEILK